MDGQAKSGQNPHFNQSWQLDLQ